MNMWSTRLRFKYLCDYSNHNFSRNSKER